VVAELFFRRLMLISMQYVVPFQYAEKIHLFSKTSTEELHDRLSYGTKGDLIRGKKRKKN